MKLTALFGAAALAVGTLVTAAPAEAQRHGYDRGHDRGYDRRDDRGWHDRGRGYDRRNFRGYDRGRHYGYGQRGYGYGTRLGYGRSRVVCRVQRGYYGPVRRCFRVYR